MAFSMLELVDLIAMSLALGFIFKDVFKAPADYDPLKKQPSSFWYATAIVTPAIIFHELAHKIVALAFGLKAVFHAAYVWLGIGIVLRLIGSGLIFFVPGYVSIGQGTPFQMAMTSVAGPATNLLLWGISALLLKKSWSPKMTRALMISRRINLFLFFFNMLPVPPFDGYGFFTNLF